MVDADVAGRPPQRPRSEPSAKSLLLTVLGELVLPHGGSAWTSMLVQALGECGIAEGNARQALARLAQSGTLRSDKQGRRARWLLTDQGRRLLTEGATRIYGFGEPQAEAWDGRWLVVVCSVPEDQRAKRHQLRSQLGFAGFGFIGPGLAISPDSSREATANAILKDLGLLAGAIVFRAEAGELVGDEELLFRGWDLDGLARSYQDFITAFSRRRPTTERGRFRALVELVHEWRRFPFADPGIPSELLPPRWVGDRAKRVFDELHAAWAPDANAWFEALEDAS